jgi:hypothetical protein
MEKKENGPIFGEKSFRVFVLFFHFQYYWTFVSTLFAYILLWKKPQVKLAREMDVGIAAFWAVFPRWPSLFQTTKYLAQSPKSTHA